MTSIKSTLCAGPVALLLATGAFAGTPETKTDAPVAPMAAPVAGTSPFDGFWAGASLGKGYSSIGVDAGLSVADGPDFLSLSYPDSGAKGMTFGVEAGYAKSFGSGWQWGAQIDHMATDLDAVAKITLTATDPRSGNTGETDFGYKVSISSMTSVLGRIGYQLNDQTLIYGLGGLTSARANGELEGLNPPDTKRSLTLGGTTFGFGLETLVAPKTAIKIEYRSTGFGSGSLANADLGFAETPTNFHASVESRADTVRLVLVHRF